MKTIFPQTLIFSLLLAFVKPIQAQMMQLGEVLIVNTPEGCLQAKGAPGPCVEQISGRRLLSGAKFRGRRRVF